VGNGKNDRPRLVSWRWAKFPASPLRARCSLFNRLVGVAEATPWRLWDYQARLQNVRSAGEPANQCYCEAGVPPVAEAIPWLGWAPKDRPRPAHTNMPVQTASP
jgi:hypothetical protein